MLYRLGTNAKMGKDSFTRCTPAMALHVRPETIDSSIDRGWFKAREVQAGPGTRIIIDAQDFCEFCRKHTRDVVGNRPSKERLDFVYQFAFPPSHTGLPPVRSAQKEQRAYEEQVQAEETEGALSFRPETSGDDKDVLDQMLTRWAVLFTLFEKHRGCALRGSNEEDTPAKSTIVRLS